MEQSKSMLGRVEMTFKVENFENQDPNLSYYGLGNAFQDIIDIVNNARCFNAFTYLQLGKFSLHALRGHSKAWVTAMQSDRRNDVQNLTSALSEYRAHGYSFWTGLNSFNNPYYWATRIQVAQGRPIYCPFYVFINDELNRFGNTTMYNYYYFVNLFPSFIQRQCDRKYVYDLLAEYQTNLFDPLSCMVMSLEKQKHQQADCICLDCWQIFPYAEAEVLYDIHPCISPIGKRNHSRILSTSDRVVQEHLFNTYSCFSPDQKVVVNEIIGNNSNILIHGPAGYGKTHVAKFLILLYTCKYGCDSVLVASTMKLTGIQLGARTLYSMFGLPADNVSIIKLMNLSAQLDVAGRLDEMIKRAKTHVQCLSNSKPQNISRIINASFFIIDEVGLLTKDEFEFVDACFRVIRKKLLIPFGGVQVVLVGDSLQCTQSKLKPDELHRLSVFNISYNASGNYYFFVSTIFSENFAIGILSNVGHRFANNDDQEWMELLLRIRTADFKHDDLNLLTLKTNTLDQSVINSEFGYSICVNALAYKNRDYQTGGGSANMNIRCKMKWVLEERIKVPIRFFEQIVLNKSSDLKVWIPEIVECSGWKFCSDIKKIYLVTENCQKLACGQLQDLADIHSSFIEKSAISTFYFWDESAKTYFPLSHIPLNAAATKWINNEAANKQLSILKLKKGDVISLTSNLSGTYLSNNQRAEIIECSNPDGSITIQPFDATSSGRAYAPIDIKPISLDYKFPRSDAAHPFGILDLRCYSSNNLIIRRTQLPIIPGSALTVASITGLTFNETVYFDNTRGVMDGEGYGAISRTRNSKSLHFVNQPKLNFDFKVNPLALAFERHVMGIFSSNNHEPILQPNTFVYTSGLAFTKPLSKTYEYSSTRQPRNNFVNSLSSGRLF